MDTKKEPKIIYIGSDSKFWMTVEHRFKSHYPEQPWAFESLDPQLKTDVEGQVFFCELLKKNPLIVYLDLTKESEGKVFLAELNERDKFNHVVMVGLVSNREQLEKALNLGLGFVFIKCAELHDVVYGPLYLSNPGLAKKTKFAEGKITKRCQLIETCRVGYITPIAVHIESNFLLQEDSEVALDSGLPDKNVPSRWFQVKNKESSNLFYNKAFSYDLNLNFVDKPDFDDESNPTPKKERVADYQERMKISRKKHKEWVVTSIDNTSEKRTKVMTIDKSLRILSNHSDIGIDKYPYAFRNYTELDNDLNEIEVVKPSIIALQCFGHIPPEKDKVYEAVLKLKKEAESESSGEDSEGNIFNRGSEEKEAIEIFNELADLENQEVSYIKKLISKIKSVENYQPYVILFRCSFQTTEKLQQTFQYPHLIANAASLSLDIILGMAKAFQHKQDLVREEVLKNKVAQLRKSDPVKHRALNINDLIEKRYFLKKKNLLSYAKLKIDIDMTSISESEITFSCSQRLPMANFEIDYPFPLYIKLIPYDKKAEYMQEGGAFHYRGLVQAINERDKKMLRRLVNEVFFEPINEQRSQEDSAYWEKHKQALEDRMKAIEAEMDEEDRQNAE